MSTWHPIGVLTNSTAHSLLLFPSSVDRSFCVGITLQELRYLQTACNSCVICFLKEKGRHPLLLFAVPVDRTFCVGITLQELRYLRAGCNSCIIGFKKRVVIQTGWRQNKLRVQKLEEVVVCITNLHATTKVIILLFSSGVNYIVIWYAQSVFTKELRLAYVKK